MRAKCAAEVNTPLAVRCASQEMLRTESEEKGQLPVTEFGGITEGGGLRAGVGTPLSRGAQDEGNAVAALA